MPKKISTICWECENTFNAWKKDLTPWGNHPHCPECKEAFYNYVSHLLTQQN